MKKILFISGCMTAAMFFTSCDKDDDQPLSDNDRTFMMQASISNTAEIGAGQVAVTKATNPAVVAFAQSMVMEHTNAQNDLKSRGDNVGFAVRDTLDPAHMEIMSQLNSLSGRAFDSVYMHTQVADHQATITLLTQMQQNANHEQVRGYADTYLPHVQMHRVRADSIATAFYRR